jgi:DNA invertase Pin-like site-specific DNA recombinase
MSFWEKKEKNQLVSAYAYYRFSAQSRQENSIEIQRDAVHAYAEIHGIKIVKEFEDAGKSGITIEGRDGFQNLLEHVRKHAKKDGVRYIICYDVTRWGRFQNTDEAAAYETECTKHGVKVIYVVHGDPTKNDGDVESFLDIQKVLERKMAGKYSRELSQKVLAGTKKVAEQGFRAGGPAPYGTVREEISERRESLGIMKPKQYKSYPNNRVRLTPDESGNANVVRKIFHNFVVGGLTESQIAETLNAQSIPSPGGSKWNVASIQNILQNEQYAGSVVYNKTSSSKLKSKLIHNPREEWIIRPNSYPPVVEREIFDKTQKIFNLRTPHMSREEIQERIRFAFKKYGMLSQALLQLVPNMPRRCEVVKEFGSLPEAFQSLFPDVLEKVRHEIRKMIVSTANDVLEYEDFLVINRLFTIKIEPVLPFPHGYGYQWYFRVDVRPSVDITLGIPLQDCKGSHILGYFPFLRVLAEEPLICITDTSAFTIGLYGYSDLNFILDHIRWSNVTNKETLK